MGEWMNEMYYSVGGSLSSSSQKVSPTECNVTCFHVKICKEGQSSSQSSTKYFHFILWDETYWEMFKDIFEAWLYIARFDFTIILKRDYWKNIFVYKKNKLSYMVFMFSQLRAIRILAKGQSRQVFSVLWTWFFLCRYFITWLGTVYRVHCVLLSVVFAPCL